MSRIGYNIKEGFISIFSHGFMSVASVIITAACLLVMGCFAVLTVNIGRIIDDFAADNIILAFVDENLSEMDAKELEKELAFEHVEKTEFITKESAYDSFINNYSDSDQALFEDIDSSVLRDRYAVYLDDISYMEEVSSEIEEVPGIAWVNANFKIAQGFMSARRIVSIISIALIAVLFVISMLIMSNMVKLTTFDRREEIAIMRMVGATKSFIRGPFLFTGFLLGILGAGAAYAAQYGLYNLLTDFVDQNLTSGLIQLVPFGFFAIPLAVVFAAIGLLVGVVGSSFAIRNYLKV